MTPLGSPYPVFWLDMTPDDEEARVEDKILGRAKAELDDMRVFCERYITRPERKTDFFAPYISFGGHSADPDFSTIPEWHSLRMDELKKLWRTSRW